MTSNNILIELFTYFARFPKRDGILPLFNVGESAIPGYNELKNKVENLDHHSLTPIDFYIFSSNEEAVLSRVNNIAARSTFLFVDFGEVVCDVDSKNRNIDSARLAITVAYRMKTFSGDLIEQTLAFAKTLDLLLFIRNKMIEEQQCHRWLKHISDNHTLVPFLAKNLSSIGWSLIFNRESFDSFDASLLRR